MKKPSQIFGVPSKAESDDGLETRGLTTNEEASAIVKQMSNLQPTPTEAKGEWEEEFDSMFNWADQIKEVELSRWKMMYGFQPKDLKSFIKVILASERTKAEEGLRARLVGEIESRLNVYYRSKFSQDCSRNETTEEKSTEMIVLSDAVAIIKHTT